jgi:hypothetical protein
MVEWMDYLLLHAYNFAAVVAYLLTYLDYCLASFSCYIYLHLHLRKHHSYDAIHAV